MTAPRILGLFAHPDDESFAAGLFALCARAGAELFVACTTRGERGWSRPRVAGPGDGRPRPMYEIRTLELEQACRELGAHPPIFLDLPDGEVAELVAGAGTARALAVLADVAPAVVVTTGPDGVYAHEDHVACTRMVTGAVARYAASDLSRSPRVLHVAFPRGLFGPVLNRLLRLQHERRRRERRRERRADHRAEHRPDQSRVVAIEPGLTADDLGVDTDAADLHIALDPDLAAFKLRVLAAHRSQLSDGDPRTFLGLDEVGPAVIDELLAGEWYTLAAGPPLSHRDDGPDDPGATIARLFDEPPDRG